MGVVPDSLALNGGAITSEATGAEADLRHDGTIIMGTRDDGGGGPEGNGPTAQFSDLPRTHDGEKPFKVTLTFSEAPVLSYRTVRDSLLTVKGATVTGAARVTAGSDRAWRVTVTPAHADAIRRSGRTGGLPLPSAHTTVRTVPYTAVQVLRCRSRS